MMYLNDKRIMKKINTHNNIPALYYGNALAMKIVACFFFFIALLPAPVSAGAQHQVRPEHEISDVEVVVRDVRQEKDSIRAILDIDILGATVAPREQLYLFPVIRSGRTERRMPPVVLYGSIQAAVVRRAKVLSGDAGEDAFASFTVKRRKHFHERIAYSATIPIEGWMKDASVAMVQERGNCRCELHRTGIEIIANRIRFTDKPERSTVYNLPVKIPVPPREEIKTRSESGEAQIIYTVGNADIKPQLAGNQSELDKIRRSIEEIRRLQGVTINSVTISSYASPEGTWQSNQSLSERRAASLTAWIRRNYDLAGIALTSRGYGEDWERLGELVGEAPTLSDSERQDVLAIIDRADLRDGREKLLLQYRGGRIYRYLLTNIYPQLRRSAYRIAYTIPEYSIETIREVWKIHPGALSLYEFYLLAGEHEPGSAQFKDVITAAAKVYPDEKINRIAMAVFGYELDDVQSAFGYLRGLEDDPDAWLCLAALHARNCELDKAAEYARRAAAAGNPQAAEYLRLIEQYEEEENAYREKLEEWKAYGVEE